MSIIQYITPYFIDKLSDREVFVFGSNLAGEHGGGAARQAYEEFGAEWGVGVGPTGRCYAIPTMQGGIETVKPYVDDFIIYAQNHTDRLFYVTRIGCGIAGFSDSEIAPLFWAAVGLPNVALPGKFADVLAVPHDRRVLVQSGEWVHEEEMGEDEDGAHRRLKDQAFFSALHTKCQSLNAFAKEMVDNYHKSVIDVFGANPREYYPQMEVFLRDTEYRDPITGHVMTFWEWSDIFFGYDDFVMDLYVKALRLQNENRELRSRLDSVRKALD